MLFASVRFSFPTVKMEIITVVSSHGRHEFKWKNAYKCWAWYLAQSKCLLFPLWLLSVPLPPLIKIIANPILSFFLLAPWGRGEGLIRYTPMKLLRSSLGHVWPPVTSDACLAPKELILPILPSHCQGALWVPMTLYKYSSVIYLLSFMTAPSS